jgi:hypothetical protein
LTCRSDGVLAPWVSTLRVGVPRARHGRVWSVFCTTGYLTALLGAHADHARLDFDVLLIDECHARSVEADLLYLLVRRLLLSTPSLKLVLMSATAHFDAYRSYFGGAVGDGLVSPTMTVGSRTHTRTVHFVDALCDGGGAPLALGARDRAKAAELAVACACTAADDSAPYLRVPSSLINTQIALAAAVALAAARRERREHSRRGLGSSDGAGAVLVFVAGWSDVLEVADEVSRLGGDGEVVCVPLHGEMAPEEQLAAFQPAGGGRYKVVVATNAAESSITLPDVGTRPAMHTHMHRAPTHTRARLNTCGCRALRSHRWSAAVLVCRCAGVPVRYVDVVVDTGQQKQLVHESAGAMLIRTWTCRAAAEQVWPDST